MKPASLTAAAFALAALVSTAAAETPPKPVSERPTLSELNRTFDRLYRSESSIGRMTMSIVTPDYSRTLTMRVYTRGMDDTLMRIESPRKEKGTATLKRGDEMWNFVPKIKRTVRIPPSLMMRPWMGSDLTNDDVVRASSWEKDYDAVFTDEGAAADEWCVDYTPKPSAAVTWSRVKVCFARADLMPRRQLYYDEKGREARAMTFSEVAQMDGRTFPTVMTLEPRLQSGRRTTIRYDEMDFDAALPDDIFSLTALKRMR